MNDEEKLAKNKECQFAVLADIASIKEQIDRAKATAAVAGRHADEDWYFRANRALRHRQIEHQQLLQSGSDLSRKIRQDAHIKQQECFERKFVDAARCLLDPQTFRDIVNVASSATVAIDPGMIELKAAT